MSSEEIDLMDFTEQGGCSAKISPDVLSEILKELPFIKRKELLVGSESCDDAAVWKVNSDTAIIQTTDFFPPLCSDPYTFGQVAASNALSDVYAMGGKAIMALNLVMFPSKKLSLNVLHAILKGGADKVAEAGAVLAGGHTIDDDIPKYGLAVTGIIHPDKIIKNSTASCGDKLILTKAIGTGVALAGARIFKTKGDGYHQALVSMQQLNKYAVSLMQKYEVHSATDITGFGLLGHAYEMALGSGVTIIIHSESINLINGVYDLVDDGCIPGAAFRNLKHIEKSSRFNENLNYNIKMLMCDAQTSGGLLISCDEQNADDLVKELRLAGYYSSTVIGEVISKEHNKTLIIE